MCACRVKQVLQGLHHLHVVDRPDQRRVAARASSTSMVNSVSYFWDELYLFLFAVYGGDPIRLSFQNSSGLEATLSPSHCSQMDKVNILPFFTDATRPVGISSVVLVLTSAVLVTIFSYAFYNVYLHPLAKFPGPLLWRSFYFPFVYYHCQGVVARKIDEFHDIYGPVIRVSPSELAFTSGEAWSDIYGLLPGRQQNVKDRYCYMPDLKGIFTAPDVEHTKHRKLLASSFSAKAIEEQQAPMMLKFVDLFVSQLKSKIAASETTQDIMAWYNWTTFDFNGEFTFGESFHCLDNANWHPWIKSLFQGLTIGIALSQLERYKIYSFMRAVLPKSAFQAEVEMKSFTKREVDQRISRGELPGKNDLFSNLLRENKELDLDWMYDDTTTLVIAGSETTATTCSATTYFLLRNPGEYAKVVDEIRDKFKSDNEISKDNVNDLPYLNACLLEALRCFPPVPTGMARRVSSKGGQVIAGHFVPEGVSPALIPSSVLSLTSLDHQTAVSVYQLASSRSASNFHRPHSFLPERWLPPSSTSSTTTPSPYASDSPTSSQPFSHGPRKCLGEQLAYLEMRLIMAKTLWNFDFELKKESEDWVEKCRPYTVWLKAPLMVDVKVRS